MRRWLLLLPLAVIAVIALALLALPAYLASAASRPTVEALASRLTGRQVRVAGPLTVTMLPSPDVSATDVTIKGPAGETITAATLTLDLSGAALLHGRLAASNLTLTDPVIALPWPLPGGAAGISPPGWLATLHAAIVDGRLSLGPLTATGVNADIYTDNGAVTLSGGGEFAGHTASVNLALQRQGVDGVAPLSLQASAGRLSLHIAGGLSAASTLSGNLSFKAGDVTGGGPVTADARAIASDGLTLRDGAAALTGTAALNFAPLRLSAALSGDGLDLTALPVPGDWPIPAQISLALTHARIFGRGVPAARLTLDLGTDGALRLDPLLLSLPGDGTLTATIARTAAGGVSGEAHVTAADLTALLAAYGLPPVAGWEQADLAARLGGSVTALSLQDLHGTLGHDQVSGSIVVTPGHADGALAFSHLDLLALRPWLRPRAGELEADGEITAASAALGPLGLSHLLIDGAAGRNLNIRRFSASFAHGLLAGSLALRDGMAQGSLLADLPAATELAPLVASLTGWAPPPALLGARLALNAAALGPPAALSTSAVATLGDFTLTAAPVLDLDDDTGAGALTLRNPNAIRALSIFNLNRGLDWPGAGSLSLRANAVATPKALGFSDFILSLGRLQASGRLVRQNGAWNGTIAAGDLDLPPWPKRLAVPWGALDGLSGALHVTADRLSLGRATLLSPLAVRLAAKPGTLTVTLAPSGLLGGSVQGTATATTAATTPPTLQARLTFDNVAAAALPAPAHAPLSLAGGTLAGAATLAATGYSPATWEDTLAGTLSLHAANGSLSGLSLPDLGAALTGTRARSRAREKAVRSALAGGTTPFTTADLAARLADGTFTLTTAALAGPNGTLTATGTADLPDNSVELRLTATPSPGPALTMTVSGPWANPRVIQAPAPADNWIAPATAAPGASKK